MCSTLRGGLREQHRHQYGSTSLFTNHFKSQARGFIYRDHTQIHLVYNYIWRQVWRSRKLTCPKPLNSTVLHGTVPTVSLSASGEQFTAPLTAPLAAVVTHATNPSLRTSLVMSSKRSKAPCGAHACPRHHLSHLHCRSLQWQPFDRKLPPLIVEHLTIASTSYRHAFCRSSQSNPCHVQLQVPGIAARSSCVCSCPYGVIVNSLYRPSTLSFIRLMAPLPMPVTLVSL